MQFQSRLADLQLRRLVYRNLGNQEMLSRYDGWLKQALIDDYLLSKQARVFYLPVKVTLATGQTAPQNGFSQSVSHNLFVVGVTHNAPTTVTATMINDTARQQQFSSVLVPPTALASNTANNIYRYMPLPSPFYLEENSRLQVVAQDPTGVANQVVTFVFQCIWTADQIGNNTEDERLDASVIKSFQDPTLIQPYVTAMTVPFTSVASQQVTAETEQDSEPLLVMGIQQSLLAKETSTTAGPTMVLRDTAQNYTFSIGTKNAVNSQIPVWAYANFTTEPEQYILFPFPYLLRPNAQLVGEFTNGTGAGVAGPGQIFFLCRRLRISLADLYS